MITRIPLSRIDLKIKKKDHVLEVGSGHNPSFRSNILVDKYINDNSNRCDNLFIYPHQKFINASGESLPFKDKEFDYVIANQVLEHAEDPTAFISELCRVSKRGYIETPSLIGEFLFPKQSHKWVILFIDNKLIFYDKKKMKGNYLNDYGEVFLNYLPYQSLPYKLLEITEGELMCNKCEWENGVDIIVNPTDPYYLSFFTEKWNREMSQKIFPPRSIMTEIKKTIRSISHLIKYKIYQKRAAKPLPYHSAN